MRGLRNIFARSPRSSDGTVVEGLTLYHFASCPFCVRVRLAARKLGLVLAERNIHRDPGARDELMHGGGKTQVPCLRIEDAEGGAPVWMYESGEIVQYLESRFG